MADTKIQETQNSREQLASAASSEVIIDLNKVNKWYGDFHVLKDIDLIVHKGERIPASGHVALHKQGYAMAWTS